VHKLSVHVTAAGTLSLLHSLKQFQFIFLIVTNFNIVEHVRYNFPFFVPKHLFTRLGLPFYGNKYFVSSASLVFNKN
jgi:hypothetical protein